jgi:hypothetical protein
MEANGLRANQVAQVRGFADRQLRHPENATSAANRRISVIVQYETGSGKEKDKAENKDKPENEKPESKAAPPAPAKK